MATLEDVGVTNFSKIYVGREGGIENPKNTLVITGNRMWYLRIHKGNLIVGRYPHTPSTPPSKIKWKEITIKTYDELLERIYAIQLLWE